MADRKRTKDFLANEIRIVLVGKTGVGKSATGNTILGQGAFESLPWGKSVTRECKSKSLKRFGRNLQIVDVPGFRDTNCSKEEIIKKIMQCVTLVSPGIHAILFVVRIGRYKEEDVKTVNDFIETFGPKSKEYVIVVFSGGDDLEDEYDIQTFIEKSEVSLKTFLMNVKNRYITVNNKASPEEKERFCEKLLDKIEELLRFNNRTYYTCDMINKVEEEIEKLESERARAIEEKNRERDRHLIEKALAEYKAELANEKISKEEETKLIEEKKNDISEEMDKEHHLEARNELREELTEAVKKTAGLYASIGPEATAEANVGQPVPDVVGDVVGVAVGFIFRAAWGAISRLFG